jgi:hypothetical protein
VNANELADKLEQGHWEGGTREQAATMLRQQQAEYYSLLVNHDKLYAKVVEQQVEIEALKAEKFNGVYDPEPYIWMDNLGTTIGNEAYKELDDYLRDGLFPLYTHPAKTLTDAEIRTIQDMCHLKNVGYNTFIMRFARAILRKASEK